MRVLVVDDHPIVAHGIAGFLAEGGHHATIAHSIEQARDVLDGAGVDLILLDVSLGEQSGFEFLGEVRRRRLDVAVVILTVYDEPDYRLRAERLDADGFLSKSAPARAVLEAIAVAGERRLGRSEPDARAAKSARPDPQPRVTRRQAEILSHLSRGLTHKEIATRMGISVYGVSYHVRRLHQRFNVSATTALVGLAAVHGQLDRVPPHTSANRRAPPHERVRPSRRPLTARRSESLPGRSLRHTLQQRIA